MSVAAPRLILIALVFAAAAACMATVPASSEARPGKRLTMNLAQNAVSSSERIRVSGRRAKRGHVVVQQRRGNRWRRVGRTSGEDGKRWSALVRPRGPNAKRYRLRARQRARAGRRSRSSRRSLRSQVLVVRRAPDAGGGAQEDGSDGTQPPGGAGSVDCRLDLAAFSAAGCALLASDTAAAADPVPLWRNIECETASRHRHLESGGDPSPTATGVPQGDSSHRRLTALDGDDFYGERCELGRNDWRDTFQVYREGERRVTFLSVRPTESLPLFPGTWQTIVQMKQAQPSAGGGGGPALEVQLYGGRFHLIADWEELWSAPARGGAWSRMALDVHYSQDSGAGRVQMLVDTDGDGRAAGSGEQSPTFEVATLKREIAGGWEGDGIEPGESIPSHLRVGVYHDPVIPCPTGCSLDVDNVQVVAP